ncbi:unnamed protein product [Effrenium voratum]|nr:unnamed protein product [Effrenium voratum]
MRCGVQRVLEILPGGHAGTNIKAVAGLAYQPPPTYDRCPSSAGFTQSSAQQIGSGKRALARLALAPRKLDALERCGPAHRILERVAASGCWRTSCARRLSHVSMQGLTKLGDARGAPSAHETWPRSPLTGNLPVRTLQPPLGEQQAWVWE